MRPKCSIVSSTSRSTTSSSSSAIRPSIVGKTVMLATRHHRTATIRPAGTLADRWADFDLYLFVTMLVMIGFGVIAIWSAVGLPPILSNNQGTKQAVLGAVGILIMFVVAAID